MERFNFLVETRAVEVDFKNDNYRVRSWRSDAINYITYCQIADLKLLTEN